MIEYLRDDMARAPFNTLVRLADASPAACQALLERVAGSAPLKRSARLRDFLLYVGDQAIRHGAEDIHEQQIGEAVFNRRPAYDTSQDNIVRVNATELRKRIETYFATEGQNEPLVFEIPRGRYTPVFHFRETDALDRLFAETPPAPDSAVVGEHAQATTAQPFLPTVTASLTAEPAAARQSPLQTFNLVSAALLVLCLCLATATSVLFWRNQQMEKRLHPWQSEPALRAFWTNFFGRDQDVAILLADTSYALAQDITGQHLSLSDYLNYRYQQAQSLDNLTDDARRQERRNLGLILERNNVSLGDLRVAQQISELETRPGSTHLLYAHEYSPDALRHGTSILIGSRRSNPWVELFEDQLVYKFSPNTEHLHSVITIEHPQPGEQAQYSSSSEPGSKFGYCVIAFLPNLNGGGDTLILAGTDSQATQAGGEFLTSESLLENFLRKIHRAKLPHFQVLLRTARLNGTPLGSEVVSYRLGSS